MELKSILACLAIAMPTYASGSSAVQEERMFAPYLKAQTGGYAGMYTLGVGVGVLDEHVLGEVLYGYVPESQAGHDLHSIAVKVSAAFSDTRITERTRWTPFYGGLGVLYGLSGKVYGRVGNQYPDVYPEGYYRSTVRFLELHLGTEVKFETTAGFVKAHGFFGELNMHELTWLAMYDNPTYYKHPFDMFSYTLGYRMSF